MTPEREVGDERRQSGGSISRLFRALTRRGSADAVSKRLSFSPSNDDAESEKGGEPAAMQADDDPLSRRKLEEKFETAASINHLGPEASTSSQSTEPEFLDSKEEQEPEQSNGLPAALVAAEVIPTSVSPTESSLQSETSLQSVKPQKVAKGREVKSRFLNSLFSNKSRTGRAGSVPRNQPSPDSRREPSLGPPTKYQVESKKQIEGSPKGGKAGRGEKGGSSRSLSLLRQRPKAGGTSKEAPDVSKEKTAEKGVRGKAGKQAPEKVEQGKAAKAGKKAAEGTENAGKEAGGRPHLSTDVSADVSADSVPRPPAENGQSLSEEVASVDQESSAKSRNDSVKPHGNGHNSEPLEASESSGRPEAAVLEAVRERLSLIEVGGASGALDASERDEEMRKERVGSGEGASTRAAGVPIRRTSSWSREETRDGKNSWSTGSRQAASRDGSAARKQSEWLAALREQNGKPGAGSGAVSDNVQRVRKPSEWLVALRDGGGEAELRAEDSAGSLTTGGEGLQNGGLNGEPPSSGQSTPGKKPRGVVVPSRVWLDSSKSEKPANDVDGVTGSRARRKAVALEGKPVSNGAPVRQRAPFSSFGDAGHWLPSSPHKPLKPTRSVAGSTTTTPAESRAATPSRQETVSAPASPHRTSIASRWKSGGSAPASPKKPSDSAQPRGSSRGRVRPLGGQQSGQEEGGCKAGTSPSKGGQKSGAANGVRAARVLHNRWLQWCFVNAKAQAALEAQQKKAEASLLSAWQATATLRTSVAAQKVQLHRETHGQALDQLLAGQTPGLERWAVLQQEHTSALAGTMGALEAAMLRVPLTNGASVDPQRLRSALADVTRVVSAAEPAVREVLPKAAKADALLSQLAETAAQERALLKECQELLARASTLEVEERSLRAHLIQLGREREAGRNVPVMATPLRQGFPLSQRPG